MQARVATIENKLVSRKAVDPGAPPRGYELVERWADFWQRRHTLQR